MATMLVNRSGLTPEGVKLREWLDAQVAEANGSLSGFALAYKAMVTLKGESPDAFIEAHLPQAEIVYEGMAKTQPPPPVGNGENRESVTVAAQLEALGRDLAALKAQLADMAASKPPKKKQPADPEPEPEPENE